MKIKNGQFYLGFFNGVVFTFAFLIFLARLDEDFHFLETEDVDTVIKTVSTEEEGYEYPYQSQDELNAISRNWCKEYNDSIEKEFQILISMLPQYKHELTKEKAVWEKYQNVVKEVAECEYHGSSTPMYVADVLNQGICLRETSFNKLILHLKGKRVYFSKTIFTSAMINNAYSAYIRAIGEEEYIDNKSGYLQSLRKEQICWNEWMECRKSISQMIPLDIKRFYDNCTNMVKRTKLFQLKNQNNALGMCGYEVVECVLPENCSDKALLSYPGFDIVWAKHCDNTDWYPKFE